MTRYVLCLDERHKLVAQKGSKVVCALAVLEVGREAFPGLGRGEEASLFCTSGSKGDSVIELVCIWLASDVITME